MNKKEFREKVLNVLDRRFFCKPSFNIYGGVNAIALWRRHFLLEENMMEVDCPCITPEVVLHASGHVDKFTDLMVKDEKTCIYHRADLLLKDYCMEKLKDLNLRIEKVQEFKRVVAMLDDFSPEQLSSKIKEYGIVAPVTKNPLYDPYPFNLMFQTSIGPSGMIPGYMRPETAQGIFVNFKDLYYCNGSKLTFAAAQIGQEISPRQGLLRVREFTLAEIEHFLDPEDKSHPKFRKVADLEFLMFPKEEQNAVKDAIKLRLGDAVSNGIVNNETFGYFIGRVYLFLTCLGINKECLRFRQHLENEMAHYAADCWDAEIECSYGCSTPLIAHEKFSEPKEVEKLVITPVKKELGLAFKGDQKKIVEALEAMDEKEAMKVKAALELKGEVEFQVCTLGKDVTIKSSMVSISKEIKKEHQRVFRPSVIEPSFGIGRIIYSLFEHSFYTRPSKAGDEVEQLNVFPVAEQISESLTALGISNIMDTTSASIRKRYVRTYELGAPFAITIDTPPTMTIRERDSKKQVRVEVKKVRMMQDLTNGVRTWEDIQSKYPSHPSISTADKFLEQKQRRFPTIFGVYTSTIIMGIFVTYWI
ncbi:hypothetical protein MKX03_023741 [Papaver bracteatum]|nr:hypothetical protein MKX03_023741 [Papaver bracteatum]